MRHSNALKLYHGVAMRHVALFVDISNLYYCIGRRFEGRRLDYNKFIKRVTGDDDMVRAIAYGGHIANEAKKFMGFLKHIGFEPKYKRVKQTPKDNGETEIRNTNWGVGITVDVMGLIDKVQVVYLASSDPDLVPLIEKVKAAGAKCIVIACGIYKEVREAASSTIEIDESYLEDPKPSVA